MKSIPASALQCMNTEGSDFWGRDYTVPSVVVPGGEVKPLWVKLTIPTDGKHNQRKPSPLASSLGTLTSESLRDCFRWV